MSASNCECSSLPFILDKRQHAARHREWKRGFTVSKNVAPEEASGERVLLVNGSESPKPLRRVAYRMARIARRAAGWDFPTFPYPDAPRCFVKDASDVLAAVKLDGRYAVGYAVSLKEDLEVVVTEVFVCSEYRRRGVATELVHALARHYERPITGIAYGGPFTSAGWALAKALSSTDEGFIKVAGPSYIMDQERAA